MEGPEVPLEQVQEELHHHASHGESWTMGVALTAALLAALAAVTALLAGHHANEGVLDQIHASDQWAFYQAKGIKAAVLATKADLLNGLGKTPAQKDRDDIIRYKEEQEAIKKEAEEKQTTSKH